MRPSVILGASLALNVMLLAGLSVLRATLADRAIPFRPLRLATEQAPEPPAASAPAPPLAFPAPAPAPPGPATPFHWSQIASTNYLAYRDQLRAIGCPEATLRDILRAEINAEYQLRRQPLVAEFQALYWTLVARGSIEPTDPDDWRKDEFEGLDEEREEVLKAVLGEDPRETTTDQTDRQRNRWEQTYAWLPEEKRVPLLELLENHARQIRELRVAVSKRGGDWTATDQAQMEEINRQLEQARTQLLSPAEIAENRLRESSGARWAQSLVGFEPTEDEWRAVARLRRDSDEASYQIRNASLSEEEQGSRREELQAELEAETRTILGAERYAEFERARDAQFESLRQVVRRHGLSDELATQAYAMVKAAQDCLRQVTDNPDLPEITRAATLRVLREETEDALRQALGTAVFETYEEYGGSWLSETAPDGAP